MENRDVLLLGGSALRSNPMRSILSMLGIAIGVAAVVLLTSVGEGARRYIVDQFSQFGTNVISINPGKIETMGGAPFGGITRKLTIDDSEAISKLPNVTAVVPMAMRQELRQCRNGFGGRQRQVSRGCRGWRFEHRYDPQPGGVDLFQMVMDLTQMLMIVPAENQGNAAGDALLEETMQILERVGFGIAARHVLTGP